MDVNELSELDNISTRTRVLWLRIYVDSKPYQLTDADFDRLPELPKLEQLLLLGAGNLTAKGLEKMAAKAPNVRKIWLNGEGSGHEAASKVAHFKNLEWLVLAVTKLDKAELSKIAELNIRKLELRNCTVAKTGSAEALSSSQTLEEITIRSLKFDEADAKALASMPKLRILEMHPGKNQKIFKQIDVSTGVFEALAGAPVLERFDPGRPLSKGEAQVLAELPSLRQVGVQVRDVRQLAELAPLGGSELELSVSFANPDSLNSALLEAVVKALPGTVSLNFNQGRSQKISNEALSCLENLKKLRRLFFVGSGLTYKTRDLNFLKKLTELELLSVPGLYKLTGGVCGVFVKMNKLRFLNLQSVKMTDGAFKKLAKLPIEELVVTEGKIGDKALESLSAVKTLRKLQFYSHSSDVNDAGLSALSSLPALEELHIGIKTATDEGFEAIARVPKLRRLSIDVDINASLSEEAVCKLADSSSLEELGFRNAYGLNSLSDSALEGFAKSTSLSLLDIPNEYGKERFSSGALSAFPAKADILLAQTGFKLTNSFEFPTFS